MTYPAQRPTGVMSGWTIDGAPPDAVRVPHSAEAILERVRALRRDLDPARLTALTEMILDHLQNHDNPHQLRLDDLTSDFVDNVLKAFMPGTAPTAVPIFAYMPELLEFSGVSVARAGDVTVVDCCGYLQTVGPNAHALDHTLGVGVHLVWPATTNFLTSSDVRSTAEAALVGGGATHLLDALAIQAPDRSKHYRTIMESEAVALPGYALSVATVAGQEYTTQFFLYPGLGGGVLSLVPAFAPSRVLQVNTATGAVTEPGGGLRGHARRLASGWWRVGLQYVAAATETTTVTAYCTPTPALTPYTGTLRQLFAVFGPQHTDGRGLGPYIATTAGPVTLAATTLSAALPASANPERGLVVLDAVAERPLLPVAHAALAVDTNVRARHTESAFALEARRGASWLGATTPAAGPLLTAALSYSPTRVAARLTGAPRAEATGVYSPLDALTTATFGPFYGGIRSFYLYPVDDTGHALEFLVGESA